MPWLQLEEENLDEVKPSPPAAKAKKPEIEQPATVVREGRDGGGEGENEGVVRGGEGGREGNRNNYQ